MDDLSAVNLTKSARAAAVAGDRNEATRLLRQALSIQPDDKTALMELALVTEDVDEKRRSLERVLALDPFDEQAKAALDRLNGEETHEHVAEVIPEVLHCANHPDRETMLRCNRCNKPICMECAVRTPVGYRCRECVRGQQDKFYTATSSNQLAGYVGAGVAGLLLGLGAYFLSRFLFVGFLGIIIAIFLGPVIGGALSELIWRASGRKRARNFNYIAAAITAALAIPFVLLSGNFLISGIIVALAIPPIVARLR